MGIGVGVSVAATGVEYSGVITTGLALTDWGSGSATLYKSSAAKVSIEPNNNDGLPNSFVIYWYQEDNMRDGEPHPYIIFQDWDDNIGTFSVTGLENNDKDGEGEWYIYKMTMDTPYYLLHIYYCITF